MYFVDSHTHTCYSFDADFSPEQMCQEAIKKGLNEIAFTDHYDTDVEVHGFYDLYDADRARKDILQVKEQYAPWIHVTYGIELGQPYTYPEKAKELLQNYDFDFVLGSVHTVKSVVDYSMLCFERLTFKWIAKLFDNYLNDLERLIEFEGICSVAHATYMHRYIRRAGLDFDPFIYRDRYEALFKKMIQKGIALEINTSTKEPNGIFMPDVAFVRLYRECGGELITVGSDSHMPKNIATSFTDAYQLLTELGFRYVTTFQERKPIQHAL